MIEKFQDESFELYNLKNDPGEKKNLAESQPQKAKELRQVLLDWQTTTDAPRPVEQNPAYDPGSEQAQRGRKGGGKGRQPRMDKQ